MSITQTRYELKINYCYFPSVESCSFFFIQINLNCPRSSVDRAVASGAMRTGSTPVGGTN